MKIRFIRRLLVTSSLYAGMGVMALHAGEGEPAPAPRLLFHITFDGTTKDTGPHHYHLTMKDVTYDPDTRTGQNCAIFNGTSTYVRLDDDEDPNIVKGAFTICFWIKTKDVPKIFVADRVQPGTTAPDTPSSPQGTLQPTDPNATWQAGGEIIDTDTGGPHTDWGISVTGGNLAFGIGGGTPSGDLGDYTLHSADQIVDGRWHYVAMTWNKDDQQMQIWLDGALNSTGKSLSNADRTEASPLTIGRLSHPGSALGQGGAFTGALSDIQIYNVVLTKVQIQTLHTHPGKTLDEANDPFSH